MFPALVVVAVIMAVVQALPTLVPVAVAAMLVQVPRVSPIHKEQELETVL